MRALVTGGTGFVGSHLVDALVAQGVTVTALVRSPAKAGRLREQGVRFVQGDLDDQDALQTAADGQDVVHHVAGRVAAPGEAAYLRVNRDGTRNLLRAAERAGVQRFVLVSSLAAAGPSCAGQPHRGGEPPRPVTAYGRSKLAGEEVVREANLPWTIVRPPMVYGPRDEEFLRLFRIARRGVAAVFGDGSQELSAVYAPDLAGALLAATASEGCVGRTYYACHAEQFTSREFVLRVARAVGSKPRIVPLPAGLVRLALTATEAAARLAGRSTVLNRDKAREFLAPAWTADPVGLSRDTGWSATHDLELGLPATAEAYRAAGQL